MTTDWIRQHVNPELVGRYEHELARLRGSTANLNTIKAGIEHSRTESDSIEHAVEEREHGA